MREPTYPATLPAIAWQFGADSGDPNPPLVPLFLDMQSCATEGEMNSNLDATLARGYTRFNEFVNTCNGTASIVGAGPTLQKTYEDLQGDVFAINSALGFLLERGVIPKYAVIWDAAEICEKFAVPHPDVTYLIASRCHPKVFDRLAGCNVIVWYAAGDHNVNEWMVKNKVEEPLINGGSAGVTRTLYIAHALGYRDLHIFGGDSSYSESGETHINGSLVPEKDFKVFVDGHWFRTTPEWCAQIEEFKCIHPLFLHPEISATIRVHGEGTLLHFIYERVVANEEKAFAEGKEPWTTLVPPVRVAHPLDDAKPLPIAQPLEERT